MEQWNDFYTREAYNLGVLAGFRVNCGETFRSPDAAECPYKPETRGYAAWRDGFGYSREVEQRQRGYGLIDADQL